jgi:hypothetical protein
MTNEPKDESESGGDAITELQEYDKWPRDVAIAFDRALGVASRKYIKNKEVDFASVVADYRAIEAEFLGRMGDNEENAQQVRRLVTETLLRAAWQKDEPLETCQRYWNDLLQLGFSRIEVQYDLTWSFADFCRAQGQTEIGLGVLDPLIADLERLRAERTDTEFAVEYYKDAIGNLRRLRAQLEAQKKTEPSQMTDEANDESESDEGGIGELMGYDKWPRDVSIAFDRALGVATLKYLKNKEVDFASVVADYRAIEAEFLPRVGDNEENAQQVRRRVTEHLLQAAWDKDQPFETCQRYWNDLLQLGFYRIERQCLQTGSFAVCCHDYGQTELGLAVLDPLIVELKRLRAEPTVTMLAAHYYDDEFRSLRKLRARLEAERNGVGSDDE